MQRTAVRQANGNTNGRTAAIFLEEWSPALTFMNNARKICFMSANFLRAFFTMWWNVICQLPESNCVITSLTNSRRDAESMNYLPLGLTLIVYLYWGILQPKYYFWWVNILLSLILTHFNICKLSSGTL